MLGAAHSMANPLTAHFGVIHGQAVGMMLPHIVRYNAQQPEVRQAYRELALYAGLVSQDAAREVAVAALISRREATLIRAGMPISLQECGVQEASLPLLATEA